METSRVRNFCIIAHIDHGKSTLADRMLQITGTVSERDMRDQVLDSMELEREKGVTIKASPVRMSYHVPGSSKYQLNLIDTPGHVDFGYEVSRALDSCEGAVLVVDATQGVEAQTLANLYLAIESNLEIIPVVNKIDLAAARAGEVAEEIAQILGVSEQEIIRISAKLGKNVEQVLRAIVERIPPPVGDPDAPLRALIFDSHYDPYKGVIAYVRVVDGSVTKGDEIRLMASGADSEPLEIGYFGPGMMEAQQLGAGEVGYLATGLKSVLECRVGDTITSAKNPAEQPLPGYRLSKPMVFAGFYPTDGEHVSELKDALEKLQLNDASLVFSPESSAALNLGFRVGFLGMFHMDIIQERLEREFEIDMIATAPSVRYEVLMTDGDVVMVDSPAGLPDTGSIEAIREPMMKIQVFTPEEYYGPVMELATSRRASFLEQEYPAPGRVVLHYEIPLAELIVDFHDQLKSKSRGYASLDYQFAGYRTDDLVKLEILINGEPLDALALIVHRDVAFRKGRALVDRLKELIPRQMFPVPIQASAGGRIIARADVRAMRKDVISKCYGGDISRKRKLLEQQKRGKKRLKRVGSVPIPQDAFLAVLRLDESG